jgi:glycosyltransferase involved in cell wall biosynthesis
MSAVDVVVPCYNYARFLPRSVESVLTQEGVTVRVLVIDDTSSDDTPAVARELARDPRVEVRRHAVNQGHIKTYNEGLLGWASAKYSLLLSADDALAPGALARATQLMDANPAVGMHYGMAQLIHEDAEPVRIVESGPEESQIIDGPAFLKHVCSVGNVVPTPTAVVRTELQQKLGGYRADLPHTGDMEMWMRFAANGAVGVTRSIQAYYRLHSANMSSKYYAAIISDRREQLQAAIEVQLKWGQDIPGFDSWLRGMRRRLGHEALWLASESFERGDMNSCQLGLQCARDLYPEISSSGAAWKFRLKRLLGASAWNTVKPVINRLRGIDDAALAPIRPTGDLTGWWPTAS